MKGGVALSQENQSCLRFSLEESLWFRRGQEVAELVSISLDPDITIQENDQYVTIRGSLELTGEYQNGEDSSYGGEENQSDQKYVQIVEEREDGLSGFSHRFPVDITIPNNRIQSIYDIDVMVESFDYTFPERSCLKLAAELTISGLYGAQQHESTEETQNFEVLYRNPVEQGTEEFSEEPIDGAEEIHLFEVEARKTPEEESSFDVAATYPSFAYEANQNVDPQYAVLQNEAGEEGPQRVEAVKKEEFSFVEVEKIETDEEKYTHEEESSSSSSSSPEESSAKLDIKKIIKEKLTKKKSMSLTEFFARKEETGEAKAKLKVCIVQKGDTIDRLAERYDVTMQNLLKVNHLELNQDVYEGQVLYIPGAIARK